MNTIRVFINAGSHPIYSDLVKFPPPGVKYVNPVKSFDVRVDSNFQKRIAIEILNMLPIPRMLYFRTDADIIHSTRGIIALNKRPWVMDIENVGSFVNHKYEKAKNSIVKSITEKYLNSSSFKKLLPHSLIGGKSITSCFKIKSKEKIEVLYPTTKVEKIGKRKGDKINILFVGRYFYQKGVHDLLEAFKILRRKYDVSLTVVSNVPKEVQDSHKDMDITFREPNIKRKDLFKRFYGGADIFIYPTYFDTSSFVVIEAMSAGLPVIATNTYAIPEYIKNGKTGFLISSPLIWHDKNGLPTWKSGKDYVEKTKIPHPQTVEQIVRKASLLIENTYLRKRIGKAAKKDTLTGKLSINERNKKLRRVYEEALRY
jgi:glycosyltransferase involved in cell wall biosynthesis